MFKPKKTYKIETIICDICQHQESRKGDPATVRHELHKKGWEMIIGETVMDVCSSCVKIVERKMREHNE